MPIYIVGVACLIGTLFFYSASAEIKYALFSERWSISYLLLTPFVHASITHLFMNMLALHFIGGQLLLRVVSRVQFLVVLAAAAFGGSIINNILSNAPAVGISGGLMGIFSCCLYRYARMPMKLLLIHDVLGLPPFPLWKMAAFVVMLDVLGIIFQWGFFAHWAHLAGFAVGAALGFVIFRCPPGWQRKFKIRFAKKKSSNYTVH
ncbi:MAG: rhomboid family intramembrane serine protease [Gammaproteobacteria bacterium WSBS_2016_MAG_OTU1]